jgi:hypothetical protein
LACASSSLGLAISALSPTGEIALAVGPALMVVYVIAGSIGPGKAKVKVIQSIGRGLRLHENKSKLQIFDFADQLTYGRRHEIKRQTLYDQETIPYKITEIREK